jgi:outer membrane protein OmpA-like peptidoglycan-associated protein
MTVGKKMIFIGGAGFFACLLVLLAKAYDVERFIEGPVNLYSEARKLKKALEPVGLDVAVSDAQLAIQIPENALFFAYDDSSLTPDAQGKLLALATAITDRYEDYDIRVVGHTDNQGGADYNSTFAVNLNIDRATRTIIGIRT